MHKHMQTKLQIVANKTTRKAITTIICIVENARRSLSISSSSSTGNRSSSIRRLECTQGTKSEAIRDSIKFAQVLRENAWQSVVNVNEMHLKSCAFSHVKKIKSPEIRVEKRVERREIINMLKQAAGAINVSAWGF